MTTSLLERIQGLNLKQDFPIDKVKARLQTFCEGLQAKIFPSGNGFIGIEPSFEVNMGREMKIVIEIPWRKFRTVFFRAYIPIDGFPVTLDLFGDEPIRCLNMDELDRNLGDFLEKPDILSSLKQYMDMANEEKVSHQNIR
ncbi:MAG: hypothetical protein NTX50_04535 [Candidatus Sumerlaeota bacterium]|nr:hypothetical protein [Candidatus Sumerlaeota bacterium]